MLYETERLLYGKSIGNHILIFYNFLYVVFNLFSLIKSGNKHFCTSVLSLNILDTNYSERTYNSKDTNPWRL